MHTTVNIHILVGLPGSGKTTFGKQLMKRYTDHNNKNYGRNKKQYRIYYMDCDNSMYKNRPVEREVKNFCERLCYFYDENYIGIFDGLFLTNSSVETLVKLLVAGIKEQMGMTEDVSVKFHIHQWNEDRQTCLHNDPIRLSERNKSAAITIKNAEYETIDIDALSKEFNEELAEFIYEPHTVQWASDYELYFASQTEDNDGLLKGESWCTGGSWGDYTGASGNVSPDDPRDFTELDNFLLKFFPDLKLSEYLEIKKSKFIYLKTWSENDYYGGTTGHTQWVCELDKLYAYLREHGYKITD